MLQLRFIVHNSNHTISVELPPRDSEVFKKYLESRRREEEEGNNAEEEGEGDFGKRTRTRRRHPHDRIRNAGRASNPSLLSGDDMKWYLNAEPP